jgi:hypothetical protein
MNRQSPALLEKVKAQVLELTGRFSLYEGVM